MKSQFSDFQSLMRSLISKGNSMLPKEMILRFSTLYRTSSGWRQTHGRVSSEFLITIWLITGNIINVNVALKNVARSVCLSGPAKYKQFTC